jgi:hypothetical protein
MWRMKMICGLADGQVNECRKLIGLKELAFTDKKQMTLDYD